MKKSTTKEFIIKAQVVHGDRYDYSDVVYVNSSTKVKIICKTHGEFWQTPNSHLSGNGCRDCGGTAKSTTQEFIAKAKEEQGEVYNYSDVVYVNDSTKVKIICRTHGEFWQTPNKHLSGQGCPDCGGNVKLTTKTFIAKTKEKQSECYNYSDVVYVNSSTKVKIICKTHGEFWQRPNDHLSGNGCPDCGGRVKLTTQEFIAKAKEEQSEDYNYAKVKYVNAYTKVKIICKIHGEFWQLPTNHLRDHGCPDCGVAARALTQTSTTEEFIAKAKEIHGERYDYSEVEYVDKKTKVKIICKIHGEFWQRPSEHLRGHGCQDCADYGFSPNKPATLYYLRVDSRRGLFYKIGITNRTVEERFSPDELSIITVINTESYEQGGDAYKEEQRVLKQFAEFIAKDVDILFKGNTELFTRDVLGLDLHLHEKDILECSPQAGG